MKNSLRALGALACLCAVSAFAQESKSVPPKAVVAYVNADEAKVKALQEYWTPERLASAKPMPLPKVDASRVIPSSAPSTPEPLRSFPGGLPTRLSDGAPELQSIPSERFPLNQGPAEAEGDATAVPDGFNYEMPFNNYRTGINNTYPYATIGKLFFVVPAGASEAAGNYVCSASVAMDNHTVVTARHCMYDYVSGKQYSGWAFYPGWANGSDATLGGAWYPEVLLYWNNTGSGNSLTTGWDIGMFAMHDHNGHGCKNNTGTGTIGGNYTGWLGYTYGGDFTQRQWNMFGYPQGAPFEGNWLYQNNGATGTWDPLGSTNVVEAGDPQTGGTSGGPWIIGFNPNNGANTNPNNNTLNGNNMINGVNSFVWTNPAQPLAMNGTIFQSNNYVSLYTQLAAKTCN
jgi:V8-like Glu-specific endopeptidase